MPAPSVTIKEVDLSTRVPAFIGVYVAACLPAVKGPIDEPFLVTNEAQFLREFTPSEAVQIGMDLGYFSIIAALGRTDKIWVMRAIGDSYDYSNEVSQEQGADLTSVATSQTTDKLVATAGDFIDNGVQIGDIVENTTDSYIAKVTAVDSATILSLDVDIFPVGTEGYKITLQGRTGLGTPDPESYTFAGLWEPFMLYAKNPGEWGDTVGVKIWTSKDREIIDATAVGTPKETGVATSDTLNHLVASGVDFLDTQVQIGDIVENTTGSVQARVTAVNSETDLTLSSDAFPLGTENFSVYSPVIPTTQQWVTGETCRLNVVSGVLPVGLVADATYYVIGLTETFCTLASSLANAQAGLPVTVTAVGTGEFTITSLKEVKEPNSCLIEVFTSLDMDSPIESFYVSFDESAKDGYGRNMYMETKLEGSDYIRALLNANTTITADQVLPQPLLTYLGGGMDGDAVTDGEMQTAADQFANEQDKPITVFIDSGWATPAFQTYISNICSARKDSISILSTPIDEEDKSAYTNAIVDYRTDTLNLAAEIGKYAALYSPHAKVYDKFNDRYIYAAPDGYAAAAIAFSAYNYEMWYPPAGFTRGLLNVLDLNIRFTKGEMDYLYDNDINPFRFYQGKGIVIWGQKTLYGRPSALDRLNVRLLLIVLQPAIKEALENFLFELNSIDTRALAKDVVDSYMEGIKARNGVYEFLTVCDETNNTPSDIDNHKMILDLYIKPTISLEYIPFTTIITSQSISFDVARAAA